MITALEALDQIRDRVQWQRENGEPDLRSILYCISALENDVKAGKTIEQVRKENADEDEDEDED